MRTLQEVTQHKKKWVNFKKGAREDLRSHGLDLEGFLIMPVRKSIEIAYDHAVDPENPKIRTTLQGMTKIN